MCACVFWDTARYDTVHLAEIPVSAGGAGFSLRRTSVRLPQGSHELREVGLKPAAD